MFEGIPLESYGMAGMVLIVAIALIWKGAELLKVALENKKAPSKAKDTPVPTKRKGHGTLLMENLKEKHKETAESMDERFDRMETTVKERLETVFYEIGRLRDDTNSKFDKMDTRMGKKEDMDDKKGSDISELTAKVARIEGRLEK